MDAPGLDQGSGALKVAALSGICEYQETIGTISPPRKGERVGIMPIERCISFFAIKTKQSLRQRNEGGVEDAYRHAW